MHAPLEAAEAAAASLASFDFEAIFHSDYARIARVIARVIGDRARAEDLAVETFWRLWKTPQAQGDHSGGWLYRTAVRLALDELRRRARRARYEPLLTLFCASPRTPHELLSSAEEQGRVRLVLANIASHQAALLLLRSDGLPYDELAAALSMSPTSVGKLLSRARAAFRKEYVKRYGQQ
ncbi:MAG TPA: sigma-70 family RNA polymerase sigma factor [Vicinamibacterales bacterium]|nr:sigma-70 family RNA polymerase sigma factor [Vicinamibacterales bacterium]